MEKLLAYHNDPAIKLKYQQRFEAHRKADEVIQGTGFENGRGCLVGCTLDAYAHSRFPIELGWPEWLAHLADRIFEGIPREEAPQFGTDLLEAVQPGKDLEPVRFQLAALRHRKQLAALADNKEEYAVQVRAALEQVIAYCESQDKTDESAAESAAESARSAAWSARSAAWSAAWSARSAARSARSAARSAAWSAEESAESAGAAESAEESAESAGAAESTESTGAAARSARSAAYCWERDTLLSLLRNM